MTTLANAIIEENISQVSEYLQSGIDVNQLDEYGFTPLVEAAIADNIEIARGLIEYGADVNLQDATGSTPLHWAAENNNIDFCQLLLEKGADPNAYTFAGQPVLVMPLLRHQERIKNFLVERGANIEFSQDFINAKLLGHMFELVGTANIVDLKNNFVEIDFEGFFLEVTLGLIGDSLAQFRNHFAARDLRHYSQLTHVMVDVIQRAARLIKYQQYRVDIKKHRSEIESLIRSEPLVIPMGYEGHAITFIKFGTIFVKCDRREDSRLYDNVFFYHMNRPEIMSVEFIKDLIYEKHSDFFVNEELPKILDLKPITELKISAQISGNCSWANVEACIPVLFFLLSSQKEDFQKNIPQYKELALTFFHRWREWNKNRALYFCTRSFYQADSIRKACKAEILAAILFQRCYEDAKEDQERIELILSILSIPQYQYILQNYIKTYCYEDHGEEGRRFLQLLRMHGYLDNA